MRIAKWIFPKLSTSVGIDARVGGMKTRGATAPQHSHHPCYHWLDPFCTWLWAQYIKMRYSLWRLTIFIRSSCSTQVPVPSLCPTWNSSHQWLLRSLAPHPLSSPQINNPKPPSPAEHWSLPPMKSIFAISTGFLPPKWFVSWVLASWWVSRIIFIINLA